MIKQNIYTHLFLDSLAAYSFASFSAATSFYNSKFAYLTLFFNDFSLYFFYFLSLISFSFLNLISPSTVSSSASSGISGTTASVSFLAL